jgi:hypothetical protein
LHDSRRTFADVFNRKKIILVSTLVLAVVSLALTLFSYFAAPVFWIYICLFVLGAARTFLWPASAAFVTSLVPRSQFARAVTFNSGAFQLSCVLGPTAFGAVIADAARGRIGDGMVGLCAQHVWLPSFASRSSCRSNTIHKTKPAEPVSAKSLVEGFRFVYQNKIILGVITLDLFAVLLGGAVTILPIYAPTFSTAARPTWAGCATRCLSARWFACSSSRTGRRCKRPGSAMLLSVAIFGVATILFGVANKIVSATGSRCRMHSGSGLRLRCSRSPARWTTSASSCGRRSCRF